MTLKIPTKTITMIRPNNLKINIKEVQTTGVHPMKSDKMLMQKAHIKKKV
jgi:hypothetical protein